MGAVGLEKPFRKPLEKALDPGRAIAVWLLDCRRRRLLPRRPLRSDNHNDDREQHSREATVQRRAPIGTTTARAIPIRTISTGTIRLLHGLSETHLQP
jgi:hypothetical protein